MTAATVVYSISARLGGGGIGYIAYNAVAAIHQAGLLKRVFVSSNASDLPISLVRQWGFTGRALKRLAAKDRRELIYYLESVLFDLWVTVQLPDGGIFHGWNAMSLHTLRRAKKRGMITVVERASSHPVTQHQLIRDEYAHLGIPLKLPSRAYRRAVHELEEADYVAIPSPFVRQSMIDAGVPEDRLLEIQFGVDLSRFQPSPTSPPHSLRAIFAGQVSVRKGVPYLLEAWQRLGWTNAELWIVGAITPDFASLQHRWGNLAGVRIIDHSTQLAQLFQQCDVFVFPSIEEGSALVTYEAMACGLPIITTPNAGSVARDGVDGYVVPIRDVDALCDRLERLRGDAALRRRMGRSARQRAEQFAWTQYQSVLITSYRRLTGE